MPISTQLIKDCWAQSRTLLNLKTSVTPSIPILWFGNEGEYRNSSRRIVTIALNPSKNEFMNPSKKGHCVKKEFGKDDRTFSIGFRFPSAETLQGKEELNEEEVDLYRTAMNEYFNKKPYTDFFDWFETPLNTLDASYYSNRNKPHRAIHVDIYTPIATNSKWGNLTPNQRRSYLKQDSLFDRLLEELNPHVILISTNKDVLNEKFGTNIVPGRPPCIHATEIKNRILIAGKNMRGTPFGGMPCKYIHERMSDIVRDFPVLLQ